MTKQEVIAKAWGVHWDIVKNDITVHGWVIYPFIQIHQFPKEFIGMCDIADGALTFRPKSLRGIETNNGWNKIETLEDIPVELTVADVIYRTNREVGQQFFIKRNQIPVDLYSHWRPHVEIKEPFY